MIKRYRTGGITYVGITSNTPGSGTSTTQHYTTVVNGPVGAVVTFKVTIYSHTSGSADYEVDSVSHVLNDTFTRTIGGGGTVSFDQFINIGTSTPGNTISVQLMIIGTTKGVIKISENQTNISLSI